MEPRETIRNLKQTTTLFEQYRQKAFSKKEVISIPKTIRPPFSSERDLEKIYEIAEGIWCENFNPKVFQTNLSLYRNNNPELKAYFKKIRKDGLILKSAYRFADNQRTLPEDYDNFIINLGKFNELDQNTPVSIVDELNSRVVRLTQKPERHGTTVFAEANSRIKWICNRVKGLLIDESDPLVEKENLHKVRKLTRHLMNLYQLMGCVAKQEEYTDSFLFLHKIVDGMGIQPDAGKKVFFLEKPQKQNLINFMSQLSNLVGK